MSKLHILSGNRDNQYSVILHVATPAGNNGAGVAWTTIPVSAGFNATTMIIGNNPGEITQAEADQIAAGTLLETTFGFWDDVTMNQSQRLAAIDAAGNQIAAQTLSDFQAKYKYFGLTRS